MDLLVLSHSNIEAWTVQSSDLTGSSNQGDAVLDEDGNVVTPGLLLK